MESSVERGPRFLTMGGHWSVRAGEGEVGMLLGVGGVVRAGVDVESQQGVINHPTQGAYPSLSTLLNPVFTMSNVGGNHAIADSFVSRSG